MSNNEKYIYPPTSAQLKSELERINHKKEKRRMMNGILVALLAVAAAAVLISVLFMPVLKVTGSSMEPTMSDGQYALCISAGRFKTGDVIAFYFNNKILLKRVIAGAGDFVDITDDGTVYVNNKAISEPYLTDKSKGEDTDIEFPYQVPENKLFVMGDHRSTSIDSRNSNVGCISESDIVGRVIFRIYPFDKIGRIK